VLDCPGIDDCIRRCCCISNISPCGHKRLNYETFYDTYFQAKGVKKDKNTENELETYF
jgi:hypothetical protein